MTLYILHSICHLVLCAPQCIMQYPMYYKMPPDADACASRTAVAASTVAIRKTAEASGFWAPVLDAVCKKGSRLLSPFHGTSQGVKFAPFENEFSRISSGVVGMIRRSGANIVEFYIDKFSAVPVIAQIEEQIKLAVAMGTFQNGDRLPSIRDVEKKTGVNRGKVYRAYLSLRKSGLLILTRGSGAEVAARAFSANSANQKCMLLSMRTIQKACQYGIPPTVFAKYLSRQAQEADHKEPFIAFVDEVKEVAEQRAGQISSLWQVPVIGMTVLQLKAALRKRSVPRKVLANHLRSDSIRSMIANKKIDVIPIEVAYTEQTTKNLAKIKANSSVLRILAHPYVKNAPFILAQLRKWIKAPGVEISWISVRYLSDIEQLLNGSQYDRIIMDPGILSGVPDTLLRHPRMLLVRLQFNPASLEAARIRAGVII
jgi:DNA-binding transcriptional regulator YhcF (GntR family)